MSSGRTSDSGPRWRFRGGCVCTVSALDKGSGLEAQCYSGNSLRCVLFRPEPAKADRT